MEFPNGAMLNMILKEKAKTAAFWVTVGLFIGWVVPTLVEFFRHLKYTP